MATTSDYAYYAWLTDQIEVPHGKTYFGVFERLHNVEFVWTIPHDDNRVQDGLDLRDQFFNRHKKGKLSIEGVTMLEIVVSLSRRVAFVASGNKHVHHWAWILLKNLGLQRYCDPLTERQAAQIDDILHNVIWRNYHQDGSGGFFPLSNPDTDQTKVEIWYQLNAYVAEMTDL